MVIIVAGDDRERFRIALNLAIANAALGGKTSLFFQGLALGLIAPPISDPDAEAQTKAGLPTLPEMVEQAFGFDVSISACQSSLPLIGAQADAFDPRIIWTGMIALLGTAAKDDRIVVI